MMDPSSRILGTSVVLLLSFAALGGCGSSVEGEPSGEGEGGSGTGGTAVYAASSGNTSPTTGGGTTSAQGGAPSTSSGSPTTTSSSGGGGGATSSSSSSGAGGAPGCDGARNGAACDVEGTTCEVEIGQGQCEGGKPRITTCAGGVWEVWTAATCDAFEPEPSCDIVGLEGSGLDEGISDQWGGAFEMGIQIRDDGRLYVQAEQATLEPGTCDLSAYWLLDEDCFEEEGERFCEYIDRRVDLAMSSEPATGTVVLECWGECGGIETAPVTATRL